MTSHPGNKVKTDSQRAADQPKQVREADAILTPVRRGGGGGAWSRDQKRRVVTTLDQRGALMSHVKIKFNFFFYAFFYLIKMAPQTHLKRRNPH